MRRAERILHAYGIRMGEIRMPQLKSLRRELSVSLRKDPCLNGTVRISGPVTAEFNAYGTLLRACLHCRSSYFDDRPAIIFENGTAFFGRWADDVTVRPMIRALETWARTTYVTNA